MISRQKQNLAMRPYKNVGEYRQKKFVTFSKFWLLTFLGESVKKGKFIMKIFFQMMLNEVLKSCKKWCLLSWCKTARNKRTGSCILCLQNLKCSVKQARIFHLILIGIPSSSILSIKNNGGGGFYLMDKICWVWLKLFVDNPLVLVNKNKNTSRKILFSSVNWWLYYIHWVPWVQHECKILQ